MLTSLEGTLETARKKVLHLFSKILFYVEVKATQSYDFVSDLFEKKKWSRYGPNKVSKKYGLEMRSEQSIDGSGDWSAQGNPSIFK